jgi:hypothetical protein
MASNVISQLASATMKLNIVKISKYRRLHEGHHFIQMTMEVHNTLRHDIDHFIKEFARLFHIDNWEIIYPCIFTFNCTSDMLILFLNML